MPFERYERSDGPSTDRPRVSIRASGSIGLNNATVETYFEGFDHAVLYYDAENRRVGIRPEDGDADDAYTVQRGDEPTYGATLNAAGFMRDYGLLPDRTTRYPAEWDDDADLVAVDLEDPVTDTGVRPAPTEAHASLSWVDDVRGASNVLLSSAADAPDGDACAALLSAGDANSTGLLAVTVERSAEEWLREFDVHADARPDRVVVVDVGTPAETARTVEREDVTVSVVPDVGDLTGIGIPVADHGSDLREACGEVVLCLDSVSELVGAADEDRVQQFVHVLAGKVNEWATAGSDVRAHYHVNDGPDVDAFEYLVDVTVTLDEEGSVVGTRR